MKLSRHGSELVRLIELAADDVNDNPRWSPDDRWIAFESSGSNFDERIYVVSSSGGRPQPVTRAEGLKGFSWSGDSSNLVYSSSSESTVLYPPIFNLRMIRRDGSEDHQLTFGDASYIEPDLHTSGKLVAS